MPKILLLATIYFGCFTELKGLSLEEIHSSSSSKRSSHILEDKTLRGALDDVRRRRQQLLQAEDFPESDDAIAYTGLPKYLLYKPNAYYMEKSLTPLLMKRQQEEVMEIPLDYGQEESFLENLYDLTPVESSDLRQDYGELSLAQKISHLLKQAEEERGERVLNMKKKRILVKRNNNAAIKTSSTLSNGGKKSASGKASSNRVNQLSKSYDNQLDVATKLVARLNEENKNKLHSKKITKRKSSRRVLEDHLNSEEKKLIRSGKLESKIAKVPSEKQAFSEAKNAFSKAKVSSDKSVASDKKSMDKKLVGSDLMKEQKRNPRLAASNKEVMKELQTILGDGKKTVKTSKNKNGKNFSIQLKKRDLSSENNDEIDPEKDNDGENSEHKKGEDFEEWLREEYYKNLAKYMINMRRKRSSDYDDAVEAINFDGSDVESDTKDEDENDDNDFENTNVYLDEDVDDNLVALEDDNENMPEQSLILNDDNEDDDLVAIEEDPKINEKVLTKRINDLDEDDDGLIEQSERKKKRKRSAPPYFGKIDASDQESEKFGDVDNKLEKIQDALINEALDIINDGRAKGAQEEVDKVENRLNAAYDLEDMRLALNDLHQTIQKMEKEPKHSDEANVEVNSVPTDLVNKKKAKANKRRSDSGCASLNILTSDCSALNDIIPSGKQNIFRDACNWHEVCYTCGEAYGLLSSDCDAGFLEESRLICKDSSACETAARLVLMPLRERRIFYKRRVPATCYQHSCVQDFLTELTFRRKR